MKKIGLLVAALAVVMALTHDCEAAKWTIKSPTNGSTFDIDSQIAASGSSKQRRLGVVIATTRLGDGTFLFDGDSQVVSVARKKWATVITAPFAETTQDVIDFIDPDGGTYLLLAGETRRGVQEAAVSLEIVD